jgi:hypothetical protein
MVRHVGGAVMSLSSSITCDVCSKRRLERSSGWFEVETGSDSFYIFHEAECSASVARTSNICGSRCLCVALERWIAKKLRMARAAALAASGVRTDAEPVRIGPRVAQSGAAMARETLQRAHSKASKNGLPLESFVPGDTSRTLEMFRKAVNR